MLMYRSQTKLPMSSYVSPCTVRDNSSFRYVFMNIG